MRTSEVFGVAAEFDETHDDAEEMLESLRQLREAGSLDEEGELSGTGVRAMALLQSDRATQPFGVICADSIALCRPQL